ncbi:MAG: alpha-galactosidase, partial [Acidobacteria bacterium]|nr:alpha-galactosidase [Acidobacteriota bacterium]
MRYLPLFLLSLPLALPAAAEVKYLPQQKVFVLAAGDVTYAMGVNEKGELQPLHFGGRMWRDEDFRAAHSAREWASFDLSATTTPKEYAGYGGGLFVEPCLKATFADGVRDVVLKYDSHQIQGDSLVIVVKDISYKFTVALHYKVYPQGIVRKHAVITNGTDGVVTLESAQSGAIHLPPGEGYGFTHLYGRWAGETQVAREQVQPGVQVIESKRGNTSHQANPWFAIDGPGQATETSGQVWFGALGWSGNWRIAVEQTPHQQVRVTAGLNPFDFAHTLQPGAKLETPPLYVGYSKEGFGGASRAFHKFQREVIFPGGGAARPRPVLYNSWEATEMNVNEAGQVELAKKAASIGVERFVMDDGWFGARDTDKAGLGDWFVSKKKFPNGLKPLIDQVKGLGMDFGLWVEPEMVNPDSDLYRAHPDWAMHFNGRPRSEARNQLILNMARNDVKEYIFKVLDDLVSQNEIAFLKWDMNRNASEPGWPEVAPAEQKKIWIEYTRNVYEIIDRLRAKHPKLEIESCSGGGGRIDLGILSRVEQVWTSDNTDALDRLKIQEGYTLAYAPKAMMAWVTDVPNFNGRSTPLRFRFLVAMQGSLGVGNNLNKWSAEDFALAKKMVGWYKGVRATVQTGKLYRLLSPRSADGFAATEYVAEDGKQAVVFATLHSQQYGRTQPRLKLQGLDAQAVYKVADIDGRFAATLANAVSPAACASAAAASRSEAHDGFP